MWPIRDEDNQSIRFGNPKDAAGALEVPTSCTALEAR